MAFHCAFAMPEARAAPLHLLQISRWLSIPLKRFDSGLISFGALIDAFTLRLYIGHECMPLD